MFIGDFYSIVDLTKHSLFEVGSLVRIRSKRGSGLCLKKSDLYLENWLS